MGHGRKETGTTQGYSIIHKHDLPHRPAGTWSLLLAKGRGERREPTRQLPSASGPPHLSSELLPALSSRERIELTSPSRKKKKVASVGERHMSGLHREPCAWQEKAMPIPAPAFHSCCNSHKRLLKPKKNKTVILIKQHSGTLKTRWRLLRPTLKLYSPLQKLHFLCAGWMDAVGLTPGSTVM